MEQPVEVGPKRRGRKRKRDIVQNATVDDGQNKVVGTRSLRLVGRYVQKEFKGSGFFLGKVVLYDSGLYRINYEDGDFEDLDSGEVKACLVEDDDLTGKWSENKEKLDELLLNKEVNAKVLKVDNSRESEKVDSSLLSEKTNGEAGSVEVHDAGNTELDADSSSDSCDNTQEGDDNMETEVALVPAPELPPSSRHIGVPEEHVSHLLSVYSFLRSFSVSLFLHPFGLDDFVGAINCSVANTLLDSVHVALMRVLKGHFEKISLDGSELASKCLRSLDWSLLDTLTWPIYLVHYLVVMGYTNRLDWKAFYTHSLERDYYTLSAGKKLIVLQILCEDVLDSEELRTEMDMREESEVGIDIDTSTTDFTTCEPSKVHSRHYRTSARRDIEAKESVVEHHDTKSSIDDDGNGDECRLCGMDGLLICCDGCPSSYHSRCLGLNKLSMPSGSWYCPECKINAAEPEILRGSTLRGGDNFGVDPYEQVFVASCDHLLVLKASINSEVCLRYYNRNDIPGVLQALNSKAEHVFMYSEICRGIMQYWELPQDILPCNKMSEIGLQSANEEGNGQCITQSGNLLDKSAPETSEVENPESCVTGISSFSSLVVLPSKPLKLNQNTPRVSETVSNVTSNSIVKYNGPVKGTCLEAKVDKKAYGSTYAAGCLYMGSSFKTNCYINLYLHGDFAASAAAKLAVLSSEENHQLCSSDNRQKVLLSASATLQLKAFSLAATRFFWPNTEKKLVEVRERCSWCLSCKASVSSKRGCLLNAAASNATKGATKAFAGVCPVRNGDGRLSGIASYILFMEESLSGLVVGPFLNDTFREHWRKQVEQATTCSAIKFLLLELEENIRTIALTGDWMKLVGGSTKSSTSQIAASAAGSTQKRRPGRRGRKPSAVVEVTCDDDKENSTDFTWWRGGKLSKLMLKRCILPNSIIRKSARRGAAEKLPGILYPEGNETPRSSRQLVWRSAVEMARNTAQLALQVRYLDFHVRWGDLARPEQIPADGKGPETEASAFRNASICDKKIVGHETRYCVAFGIQKHLPSRVMKNITEIEQLDDGKERYWFSETYIPLYLVREYEQKVEKNKPVDVLSKLRRKKLKASCKNIFLSLFWKQDIMVRSSCCSCHQHLFYRNAVKCSSCQGFCHEPCATSSTVNTGKEVEFLTTCKQCIAIQAAARIKSSNGSPTSHLCLQGRDFPNPATSAKRLKIVSSKGSLASNGTLERSSEVKSTKRSSEVKSTKRSSSASNGTLEHSSEVKSSAKRPSDATNSKKLQWGLIWRKKDDDTGSDFRLKNLLLKGNANGNLEKPICRLCSQAYNPDLTYIRCETCTHWFHADAVELEESKIFSLVGFKCSKCRRIRSPVCPYLDPKKKKLLEIRQQQAAKPEIPPVDFNSVKISEHRKEAGPAYSAFPRKEVNHLPADDPLLVSLSKVENCTEDESKVDYNWNNATVSGPGPRKLPVRRHIKQEKDVQFEIPAPFEANVVKSTEKLPVRRHVKRENNLVLDPSESNVVNLMQDSFSPQVQSVVASKESFDDGIITLDYDGLGYDDMDVDMDMDMQFEPQTYFSFNELLAADDGANTNGDELQENAVENWEGPENGTLEISYDEEEPIISLETTIEIVPCKICSNTEPCPDLSCQICGLWLHSHCSPWIETLSWEDGWRCGYCREWR